MRKFWFWISAFLALGILDAAAQIPYCPPTDLESIIKTRTAPPYPPESLRAIPYERGTTILKVDIDANGVPTSAVVLRSSSSDRLDNAAIAHVLANWRWTPPTRNCEAVASRTLVSLRWDPRNGIPPFQR